MIGLSARVVCSVLKLGETSNPIVLDSDQWFDWLNSNKSFRFDGKGQGFTAQKNQKGYWYAQRRVRGNLLQKCLGKSDKLTEKRLYEIEEFLTQAEIDDRPHNRLQKRLEDGLVNPDIQTLPHNSLQTREIRDLVEGLKAYNRDLREQLEEATAREARLRAELNDLKSKPSTLDLIQEFQAKHDSIVSSLPRPPKNLTRNWTEQWRFKTWLESL